MSDPSFRVVLTAMKLKVEVEGSQFFIREYIVGSRGDVQLGGPILAYAG